MTFLMFIMVLVCFLCIVLWAIVLKREFSSNFIDFTIAISILTAFILYCPETVPQLKRIIQEAVSQFKTLRKRSTNRGFISGNRHPISQSISL